VICRFSVGVSISEPKTSHRARLQKWPEQDQSTLWWNVRKVSAYIRSHIRFLVDYGARYRKGLPISSGIVESAVNQVVSIRMAKQQQMRWSDERRSRAGIGESGRTE
jgi:hypothetical protein